MLGHLVKNLQASGNDFLCGLMTPNFLKAIITNNCCPRGTIKQSASKSKDEFCALYNAASQSIKDCLSKSAAAQIRIDLPGIVNYTINFGRCCTKQPGTMYFIWHTNERTCDIFDICFSSQRMHLIGFDLSSNFFLEMHDTGTLLKLY